jgi:hypothetical protein
VAEGQPSLPAQLRLTFAAIVAYRQASRTQKRIMLLRENYDDYELHDLYQHDSAPARRSSN